MNNNFYLPTLTSIEIKHFSLYPNGLDFKYDFVEGVNLIIGGNGLGKTTFLNLIKYGIIGLYKKETDVRTREEKRIEKRINFPYDYFKNRMNKAYEKNSEAEIILTFKLNETQFIVRRSLEDITLKEVTIKDKEHEYKLTGSLLSQNKYDSHLRFNPDLTNDTLQKNYEDAVSKVSKLGYFDNLIFLVNEILFFGESRKTIVWEKDRREESSIQSKLSSKYFNDPKLDNARTEAERNAKYHDSVARHFSEDIRAINKVIDKISDTDKTNKSFKQLAQQIELQKGKANSLNNSITENEMFRQKTDQKLNEIYAERNKLIQNINEIESKKRSEEELLFKEIWQKLNPKYHAFLKYIKDEEDCPLCNKNLPEPLLKHIIAHEASCMLCGNSITETKRTNPVIQSLKAELNQSIQKRSNIEKEIINLEQLLAKLDHEFTKLRVDFSSAQTQLRRSEYSLQQQQANKDDKTDIEFRAMKSRIDELEESKVKNQDLSRTYRQKVQTIDSQIDEQRLDVRKELSTAFSSYASQFLGVECELVYDDFGEGLNKRYLPLIAGSIRKDEEELSESQRFFIDQSFRMCLLNYFYTTPTFFMCETPDSSLDISYEHNAAKIFLKYVEKPNALIITSNLNNSEFLDYIISKTDKIGFVNLLDIGRQSNIQSSSEQLSKASKKIEQQIYAKRH